MLDSSILNKNYYSLFNLTPSYLIDQSELRNSFRELQKQYHPDNFANQDNIALNQALNISSYINQAFETLSQPLARAIYLLKLKDVIIDLVHDTKFSHEFLMQQIDLRERISEAEAAEDIEELELLEADLRQTIKSIEGQISELFNHDSYPELIELVKQLAFYGKLELLVNNILTSL